MMPCATTFLRCAMRTAAAALLLAAAVETSAAEPPAATLEGAKWIWYGVGDDDAGARAPAGSVFFRAGFNVSEQSLIKSAELVITADNLYLVSINGQPAAEGHTDPNAWNKPKRFDVAGLLLPGHNLLAVEAINTVPGPAGLIVRLAVQLNDGQTLVVNSDGAWKCSEKEEANWQQASFDDNLWRAAHVVGEYGVRPWGKPVVPATAEPAGAPTDKVRQAARQALVEHKAAARRGQMFTGPSSRVSEFTPPADYAWPAAVAFLGDDCTLYRPLAHTGTAMDSLSVTVFTARKSRAFPEHDLPSPIKMGRKLYVLRPARPGAQPQLLLDAGRGAIGSPSPSFDGQWLYVAMARDGEPFFHIYRVPAAGGPPQRLTDGPFHDIDPAELPDGRIAFTSTRIGMFDEYHNPPARALYAMNADGSNIRPLTHTFVFDNEPEVLADGRIIFIRSDNFFDRGKVETLLHAVHPDGSEGYTEFGLDNGPEYGGRLRAFYCGSPAPLPDGRLAFISGPGITVGRLGSMQREWQNLQLEAGDVAATADGRLLCTVARRVEIEVPEGKAKRKGHDLSYERIGLIELDEGEARLTTLFESPGAPLHSPVFLGLRTRPPLLVEKVDPRKLDAPAPTGVLFCQNARFTKNTTAGWPHVRAIRVLAGKGLTVRSSHSYIVHAGSEVIELGTVPLPPDGSFAVEVPADTAIAFQAVDAEGRSELNTMSWLYVRPGERRGCVGCHQSRQATPLRTDGLPAALQSPPLKLLGQGRPHRFRGNNAAVTGMMELQFDRYREVAGLDRHNALADPLATGPQEEAALAAQLAGPDEGLRISAAQRLAIFRSRAAAPALARALGDANREVRVAAAVALAACGTRETTAALLAALDDPEPLVCQAAAMALENLTGHAEPFSGFAPAAQRRAQAEAWRAWFAQNDWPAIEADLVQRLARDDRDEQRRAAVALGHVGGDAARDALRAFVLAQRDDNPYPEWRKERHYQGDNAKFNALSPLNPRTLQAAARSLGYLQDAAAVPLLAETLRRHSDPHASNLFLAEATVEALGRIGTPAAEAALVTAMSELKDYFHYVGWYGDHPALFACHSSPVHHFIAEALDGLGSKQAAPIIPHLIRSLPTDVDRALFPESDDCETLVGRVIRRAGAEAAVVETCLAILGEPQAKTTREYDVAIGTTYQAWGGKPDRENRAAQVLSLVCRDRQFEPRVRAAFDRYRARPNDDIARVFDRGIPVVQKLPVKNWVCFFLARTLGNLRDPQSVASLVAALEEHPHEAAAGHPDPAGPGVLFLHNELTPCWRAAAAWALGRIGDRRATAALLKTIGELGNAVDTRHAAAEALGQIADPATVEPMRRLAAGYPEFSTRRALLRSAAAVAAPLAADGR